jgi:hypothetical protein
MVNARRAWRAIYGLTREETRLRVETMEAQRRTGVEVRPDPFTFGAYIDRAYRIGREHGLQREQIALMRRAAKVARVNVGNTGLPIFASRKLIALLAKREG